MRRSSAVILVSASTATLGIGWIAGSGAWDPPVPASEPAPPQPMASAPVSSGTAVPTTPAGPVVVDGPVVDTEKYGTVQVQVVVTDDAIIDVIALKLTDLSSTSVEVSARAEPILRESVLAAQSAEVDNVSGATFTSEAYLTSLQSALDSIGFTG